MSEPTTRILRRWVGVGTVSVLTSAAIGACGSIPDNSAPQPITSFARQGPTNALPVPQPDMDPESLVRAYLKATADPRSGHRAARRFLTPTASQRWDDRGDTLVVDEINVFVDQRTPTAVRLRLIGDDVGTLKTDGQLLPATGRVETALSLTRVGDQWRIDGSLPNGTMLDRAQFDATYRAKTLYFTAPDGQRLVADPRWLYAGQATDPTILLTHLMAGAATDLDGSVVNGFPPGSTLRGPVSPMSGGGVRIELAGVGALSVRDRTALAAQIIWTLANADIGGPYVINADGAPLVAEKSSGWQTADVRSFDPNAAPATDIGLNIVRNGALEKVTNSDAVPVGGLLGSGKAVRSAAIAPDGSRASAVLAMPGPTPRLELDIGSYGGPIGSVVTGTTITRPSFGPDGKSLWSVVNGTPVRWQHDDAAGADHLTTVDASSIASVARGPINELQVSPDGVRVALLVGGQVVFAVVTTNGQGGVALTSPRIAAYNIGNRAVSIDWASPTTLMIARDEGESPVVQLPINGTPAVGLLSGNLSPPVRAVVANESTVYVGDSRGVLRLGSTNGQPDQYWTEVEPAMAPNVIPVLP